MSVEEALVARISFLMSAATICCGLAVDVCTIGDVCCLPVPAHQPFSSNSLDLSAPEEAYSRNVRASVSLKFGFEGTFKKVNRKVKGMPQSQTAANPRH